MENIKNGQKKQAARKGIVKSANNTTIIVAVEALKTHPKYQKQYRMTKRYKVHDPKNTCKIGDTVEFVDCRPISKGKRYIVNNV